MPGIKKYFIEGYTPNGIPHFEGGSDEEEFALTQLTNFFNNSTSGLTIGPDPVPEPINLPALLDRLISLKQQSVSLDWVQGEELIKQLDGKLIEAKDALASDKGFKARQKLVQFVDKLEEHREQSNGKGKDNHGSPVNDNAFYLLKVNAEFISVRLPDKPGNGGIITFDTLRQDITAQQKLNQIGDDKFVGSLTRMVNTAEKLLNKCEEHKKEKCAPAIAVLNMFVKRLEAANRKCDSKDPKACDEDNDWNDFGKEHRKDHDYDDFFREWDRDDWHKHKKTCKRFVSDEALKIIKEDAQWLINSLGGGTKDSDKGKQENHEKDDK